MTCRTESAMTPMTVASPSHSTSVITMQVSFPTTLGGKRNLIARSITGTTFPRRLMTPRTHCGVFGISVTTSYSMISFTFSRLTAYSSPPIMNVRYCWTASAAWFFSSLVICIRVRLLESGKVVFNGRAIHLSRRHRDHRSGMREGFILNRRLARRNDTLPRHSEKRHQLLQSFRLGCQFLRCTGELLRRRRIALGHGVDRGHRLVDLSHA